MKKIVIINGHPDEMSLCNSLATAYYEGAKDHSQATLIHLRELTFSLNLAHGYRKRTELEPDLVSAQKAILEADHLVFAFPNWWGTYPALLKGFIDRVFLPGFVFNYREGSVFWDKLLKGKTGRILMTMDTPKWYYKWVYQQPGLNSIKKSVLAFCGVRPVKSSVFCVVKQSTDNQRSKWIAQARKLGESLK